MVILLREIVILLRKFARRRVILVRNFTPAEIEKMEDRMSAPPAGEDSDR